MHGRILENHNLTLQFVAIGSDCVSFNQEVLNCCVQHK